MFKHSGDGKKHRTMLFGVVVGLHTICFVPDHSFYVVFFMGYVFVFFMGYGCALHNQPLMTQHETDGFVLRFCYEL